MPASNPGGVLFCGSAVVDQPESLVCDRELVLNVAQQLAGRTDSVSTDASLVCTPQLTEHRIVYHSVLCWVRICLGKICDTQRTTPVEILQAPQENVVRPFLAPLSKHTIHLPQFTLWQGAGFLRAPCSPLSHLSKKYPRRCAHIDRFEPFHTVSPFLAPPQGESHPKPRRTTPVLSCAFRVQRQSTTGRLDLFGMGIVRTTFLPFFLAILPASAVAMEGEADAGKDRSKLVDPSDVPSSSSGVKGGQGSPELAADEPLMDTLDNGLRVLIIPTSDDGIVSVQTWIDVGSGDETEPGTTGYAHFFEHLMFHGTPKLGRVAREERLVEMGVEENAWTSQDETCYHLLAPAQHLETLLEMEWDRFANLALTEEGVRREAGAVYGEFRKGQADPDEQLWEALWADAFSVHPYRHSTLGIEDDIAAMPTGLARALRFRSQHYRPDKALVVVTGDLNVMTTLRAVDETFGHWQVDAGATAVPAQTEPAQGRPQRRELGWDGPAVEPKMLMGWRTPAFEPGAVHSAALDVVMELLSARDAPLYRQLVDEQALAWRVWAWGVRNADPGLAQLSIDLRAGADPDAVLEAVDVALHGIAALDDAAIQAATERMRRQKLIGLASPQSRAFSMGGMALRSTSPTAFHDHVAAVQAVTAQNVQTVLQSVFVPSRRTVVTLGTEGGK